MEYAAHLVNQAAKDAGAIINKSGRGALHLYHLYIPIYCSDAATLWAI